MPNVLVVGDSRKMKGGVSTVIKTIESSFIWKKYHCHWIQCQINSSKFLKVLYLLNGYLDALLRIPFYDIVYFHTAVGIGQKLLLPMLLYARIFRKKVIVELHVGNQICDYLKNSVFQYWVKHVDLVLTLGKKWRDLLLSEKWVKTQVDFLYNPAPRVLEGNISPKKYFLFAAYLDINKGYDTLIEAFSSIIKQYPDWKLKICGVGNVEDVQARIKKVGLEDNVELLGWVEGDAKFQLFKEAYAYCMTSEKEGLPMSVLESMAYGVPVISTYVGCLPEIITNEESALMYNYGDVDALAQNMKKIIESPKLRAKLSENSREIIKRDFETEVIIKKLDEILSSILHK